MHRALVFGAIAGLFCSSANAQAMPMSSSSTMPMPSGSSMSMPMATSSMSNGMGMGMGMGKGKGGSGDKGGSMRDAVRVEALIKLADPSMSMSVSPAQSSQIAADAKAFMSTYTMSHPASARPNAKALASKVMGDLASATTKPSPDQIKSIMGLVKEAGTGKTSALSALSAAVTPFPFAADVLAFASSEAAFVTPEIDGLKSIVFKDLSMTPSASAPTAAADMSGSMSGSMSPTPVPSGSTGAAMPAATAPAQMLMGAVAAAAGMVGVAML